MDFLDKGYLSRRDADLSIYDYYIYAISVYIEIYKQLIIGDGSLIDVYVYVIFPFTRK